MKLVRWRRKIAASHGLPHWRSPRTGKTTLTEALARKLALPFFTLDHVTSVIAPYIAEADYPARLPLVVARQATEYSNDRFYATYAPDEAVDFYVRQAETYWPGVRNFITYAIEDEHDLIMEGWQILPHLLHTAIGPDHRDAVTALFLYKTDVERIVSGLKASTARNDWVMRHTKGEQTFRAIAAMVSRFGHRVAADAQCYGFRGVDTDEHFEDRLREALEALSQ